MNTQTEVGNQAVSILKAGRARLEGHWYKGGWDDGGPPDTCGVCALGALWYVAFGATRPSKTAEELRADAWGAYSGAHEALNREVRTRFKKFGIADYNDHEGTTEQDVLDVFTAAIDALSAGVK